MLDMLELMLFLYKEETLWIVFLLSFSKDLAEHYKVLYLVLKEKLLKEHKKSILQEVRKDTLYILNLNLQDLIDETAVNIYKNMNVVRSTTVN